MIEIDGAEKAGSGTIVRDAVALAALLAQELHLVNIRAKREQPGLRPQHLAGVQACATMCRGSLEGAEVGSQEIRFRPGDRIRGDYYEWDIGTAGSTTMVALLVLPLACFADKPTIARIKGGLFQDFAPSAYHMQHVLFPTLRKMGIYAELEIVRPGYVPKGGGIIEVTIRPVKAGIKPLKLLNQGNIARVKGIALCSHLQQRKVSERMADECRKALKAKGYDAEIEEVYDSSSIQAGANLGVHIETESGCFIGADRAGEPRRTSEAIGRYVARNLLEDMETRATVDRYLADQLIPFCALADGTSEYLISRMTEHVETRLWLVGNMLGVQTEVKERHIRVQGVGYRAK